MCSAGWLIYCAKLLQHIHIFSKGPRTTRSLANEGDVSPFYAKFGRAAGKMLNEKLSEACVRDARVSQRDYESVRKHSHIAFVFAQAKRLKHLRLELHFLLSSDHVSKFKSKNLKEGAIFTGDMS